MQWLNKIVDELIVNKPEGEILVESGISPSGVYHLGYLREILICDAIVSELKRRNRKATHIHFVDDQDGLRKVPNDVPKEYEKFLGRPLFDIPAPHQADLSYADWRLKPFMESMEKLGIDMQTMRSHIKYQEGFFIIS